jgi:hypothetical protein
VTIKIFTDIITFGYMTIFSIIPAICFCIDDELDLNIILDYPEIYKTLNKGRETSIKMFCVWLYQSVI